MAISRAHIVLACPFVFVALLLSNSLFSLLPAAQAAWLCCLVLFTYGLLAIASYRSQQQQFHKALARLNEASNSDSMEENTVDQVLESTGLGKISELVAHFRTRGENVAQSSSTMAISAAEVSFSSDELKKRIDDQVAHIQTITNTTTEISRNVKTAASDTEKLSEISQETRRASYLGQESIESAQLQIRQTGSNVQDAAILIGKLEERAEQIIQITSVINGIAEQTNLLALNAAIEAARAGEQGRGFAVVADEVRSLATRTSSATSEIGSMVEQINRETGDAGKTMRNLVSDVEKSQQCTEEVHQRLTEILDYAREVETRVMKSGERAEEIGQYQSKILGALASFTESLDSSSQKIQSISEQSQSLSEMTEGVFENVGHASFQAQHKAAYEEAISAATAIQAHFEAAVKSNQLSIDDLFDRSYQAIENTDPQKFSTRFDTFTDENLPTIQEPILERHKFIAYAGAVDDNGYFPTHNLCYTKPLTGDYEADLLANRTKRIFNDRTGSRCGSNTKPFLLQTYKRDTGEVMHDLSVPIAINGRHWGGFRIGYRSESTG